MSAPSERLSLSRLVPVRPGIDIWLLAILFIAACLRLQFISMPLVDWFNWREASTAMMAENLPRNGWNPLWPQVNWTGDQPGYQGREFQVLTFAAALLDSALGWRDWHGRAVAIAFGLTSVLALYGVCLRLYGRQNARFVAFIFSLMPGVVAIDSSYLPDPAMLSLCLIAFWLLVEGLHTGRRLLLVLAAIAATVSILAKLPALAALPATAYLVWSYPDALGRRKRMGWLAAWFCLTLIPVAAYYRWAIYLGATYPPYHVAGEGNLWDVGLSAFLKDKYYLPALYKTAAGWLWTQPYMVLAAIGIVPFLTLRGTGSASSPWFFHFWAGGCVVLYLVAARELTSNPHNLHIFSPAVAAFCGFGFAEVCSGRSGIGRRQIVRFLALSALLAAGTYTGLKAIMLSEYAKLDHRLGTKLDEFASGDDLVIVAGSEAGNPLPIYYSRQRGWVFPPAPNHNSYDPTEAEMLNALSDLRRRGGRWFAYSKLAHDHGKPRRYFAQRYPRLLAHVAEIGEVVFENEEFLIYRLP